MKYFNFFSRFLPFISKKSVIFAYGLISLVILNFSFFDILILKSEKFQNTYTKVRVDASLLICMYG
jgi:hypothetical protein